MDSIRRGAWLLCVAVLALGIGCTPSVKLQDGDASTSGSDGGGGNGDSSSLSTTSGPTGTGTPCEIRCALPCVADGPDCVAACELEYESCTQEHQVYSDCIMATFEDPCVPQAPDGCYEAIANLQACKGIPCAPPSCTDGPEECLCLGECGNSFVEVACRAVDGEVICDCSRDGEYFGQCVQEAFSCDPGGSCCHEQLF